jgi:hypothetical protein
MSFGGRHRRERLFSTGRKYCHNGGRAFRHHHGVGLHGVHDGDHGPVRLSPENALFAGKKLAGSGVRALWGQQWTRLPLFFTAARSTCPTGACFRPPSGASARHGSKGAMMAPSHGSLKRLVCRRKGIPGSGVRVLWGQGWARLPLPLARSTTATVALAFAHHHGDAASLVAEPRVMPGKDQGP